MSTPHDFCSANLLNHIYFIRLVLLLSPWIASFLYICDVYFPPFGYASTFHPFLIEFLYSLFVMNRLKRKMVKLYALSILYKNPNSAVWLKAAYDLQTFSFFQRGSVQEFMAFVSKTIVERTQTAARQSVKEGGEHLFLKIHSHTIFHFRTKSKLSNIL